MGELFEEIKRTPGHSISKEIWSIMVKNFVEDMMDEKHGFHISTNSIANKYKIDWNTAKKLIGEGVGYWKRKNSYDIEIQREWIRRKIERAEYLPSTCEEVKRIRFQLELFDKLNALNKLAPDEFIGLSDDKEKRYVIAGKIGPNMLKLFEEKGEKINVVEEENGSITDDETN
jgi:hypothetical protein